MLGGCQEFTQKYKASKVWGLSLLFVKADGFVVLVCAYFNFSSQISMKWEGVK
jgi:hypothetical protein